MGKELPLTDIPTDKIINSIKAIAEHFNELENISLFFNGGKDSTLLLHLFRLALENYALLSDTISPIPIVYIELVDDFPELKDFVEKTAEAFPKYLKYVKITADSLKDGVNKYSTMYPERKNVFLGIRKNDPYMSNVKTVVNPSTPGWPTMSRIYPLLDWDYNEVWSYILNYNIVYCKLYEMGYSSIGEKSKSNVNPYLIVDGNPIPAYKLPDPELERLSRN